MAITVPQAVRERVAFPVRDVLDSYREHRLGMFASAIAFQIATTLVPFTLFVLALLGFCHLDDVYDRHVLPEIAANTSPAMTSVLNDTAGRVISSRDVWWLTVGAALAIWQMSGALRAAGQAVETVYDSHRPTRERYLVSLALAPVVGLLFVLAVALVQLAPLLYGDLVWPLAALVTALRWLGAAAALALAIGLVLRHGPSEDRPLHRVTLGAWLAVGCWLIASLGFGLYLTVIASYGSVYGALASIVVLFAYLYVSSAAFLVGVQIDNSAARGLAAKRPNC